MIYCGGNLWKHITDFIGFVNRLHYIYVYVDPPFILRKQLYIFVMWLNMIFMNLSIKVLYVLIGYIIDDVFI